MCNFPWELILISREKRQKIELKFYPIFIFDEMKIASSIF